MARKINYGSYYYYNENEDPTYTEEDYNAHKYNPTLMNQMISNRQYNDAASYASQYIRANAQEQSNHQMSIYKLQDDAVVNDVLYGQATEDQKQAMEFLDCVFVNGGFENWKDNNAGKNNKYIDNFVKDKAQIGISTEGLILGAGWDGEATSRWRKSIGDKPEAYNGKVTLTLPKAEQDWWFDNNYQETFWQNSGLNKDLLRNTEGIELSEKDGDISITFDKSHKYANQILYGLGSIGLQVDSDLIKLDSENNKASQTKADAYRLYKLVEEAKDVKNSRLKKMNAEKIQFSSVLGDCIFDNVDEIHKMRETDALTESQYQTRLDKYAEKVRDSFLAANLSQYHVYSNKYQNAGVMSMNEMNQVQVSDIWQDLTKCDPKQLQLRAAYVDGEMGVYVTRFGHASTNARDEDIDTYQIFIPGFLSEETNKALNKDTGTRAAKQVSSMNAYKTDYVCADNSRIYNLGNGYYKYNNEILDQESATRRINLDMIIKDGKQAIIQQGVTASGDFIVSGRLAQMATGVAIEGANELYPNVEYLDIDGNELDMLSVFQNVYNQRSKSNEPVGMERMVKPEVYKKITTLFTIYSEYEKQIRILGNL